jgi:hypothetical protein
MENESLHRAESKPFFQYQLPKTLRIGVLVSKGRTSAQKKDAQRSTSLPPGKNCSLKLFDFY